MNVLDLFSGVGGFSLGLERAGMHTVAFVENEPYCRAVLRRRWPGVPLYNDVRELSAAVLAADGVPAIDLICGGFPCTDISVAGTRTGITGPESGLWREFARVIGEVRPQYAIIENVPGLLSGADGIDIPIDRCVCGWPYRWRRVPLDPTERQSLVHAPLRHRYDDQGEADIGEVASAVRGFAGQSSQSNEGMGSGTAVGDQWSGLQADVARDKAASDSEIRAGTVADDSNEGEWPDAQGTRFRVEPEGAECGATGRLVCPSCGREVAQSTTRSTVVTWMGRILAALAEIGFHAEWHCIPACYVGAPHERDRIWIVAYPNFQGLEGWDRGGLQECPGQLPFRSRGAHTDTNMARLESERLEKHTGVEVSSGDLADRLGATGRWHWSSELERARDTADWWWQVEPPLGRVVDGVPHRVDRLRALGNAAVPQVAEFLGQAILTHAQKESPGGPGL